MPRKLRTRQDWWDTLPTTTRALLERHDAACHLMQRGEPMTEDERYDLLLAVVAPKTYELQAMAA